MDEGFSWVFKISAAWLDTVRMFICQIHCLSLEDEEVAPPLSQIDLQRSAGLLGDSCGRGSHPRKKIQWEKPKLNQGVPKGGNQQSNAKASSGPFAANATSMS
jgi:hypothetical protein